MNYQSPPDGKDARLWQLAQRRVSFKRHLTTYIIVIVFLWILWAFNGAKVYGGSVPWPLWPTLGWGIGIVFHYFGAYGSSHETSVEKEYQKLKQNEH